MAIFNSYEIPGKESMGTWTFLDPSGTSCAPGWFFDASTELCKMLGRRFLPGLCGIIIVYYRVYYSILSYIIVYYSTHMLHVYLPTFGWFLGQLLVHIPYMEHRGYIYVYIYIYCTYFKSFIHIQSLKKSSVTHRILAVNLSTQHRIRGFWSDVVAGGTNKTSNSRRRTMGEKGTHILKVGNHYQAAMITANSFKVQIREKHVACSWRSAAVLGLSHYSCMWIVVFRPGAGHCLHAGRPIFPSTGWGLSCLYRWHLMIILFIQSHFAQ